MKMTIHNIDLDDLPCDIEMFLMYCSILSMAVQNNESSTQQETINKILNIVLRLLKKHGSDSPGAEDQRRFHVDLFTKALAIAKGEEL